MPSERNREIIGTMIEHVYPKKGDVRVKFLPEIVEDRKGESRTHFNLLMAYRSTLAASIFWMISECQPVA